MDDDGPFAAWFGLWKLARPQMTPIGWYTVADLEAAYNAGAVDMKALCEAQIEHVLRAQDTQD